jgi:hypothetical protein
MLFNLVLAFALLFVMAFLLINPPSSPPGVQVKAEYIITVTWPSEANDDIDTWLLLPDGQRVGFSNPETAWATLDRDDRGIAGDVVTDPATGTETVNRFNQEIITIRTTTPGTYVLNLHVFASHRNYPGFPPEVELPYPVTVTLTALNPRVQQLHQAQVVMTHVNHETTAFEFVVHDNGSVTINDQADRPFVRRQL